MRIAPELQHAAYLSHHESLAIRTLRAYFQAEPPATQRETLARVQRCVAERPQGWLAKYWRRIYVSGELA